MDLEGVIVHCVGCEAFRRWGLAAGSGSLGGEGKEGRAVKFCSMALLLVCDLLPDCGCNASSHPCFCNPSTIKWIASCQISCHSHEQSN